MLLMHGDHYMHLADLRSYLEADERLCALYANSDDWARKAILNVAGSGKFSSDRTIAEYAAEIWRIKPCPIPETANAEQFACSYREFESDAKFR
jgi:starch phosphorylase